MPPSTLQVFAALADPSQRRVAAQALATFMGAEDLIVFVRDPEITTHLPAVGFPKTLPSGRAWHEFVGRCADSAALLEADLPYPDAGRIRHAVGLSCQHDSVLVLLGGAPHKEIVEEVRSGFPLITRIFQAERAVVAGVAHAAIARASVERAEALTASLAASQTELHRAVRRLYDGEQSLSITLRSIGDAVIATDASGRVTFMNSVAETLTGWTLGDATNRPLDDIFDIVDETSRSRVESPVVKVLREGKVVELANHSILVRRDGVELSVDDSAAPIHDANGVLTGVVLVFRDVTRQRGAERERAEQHRLAELGWRVGAALTSKAPLEKQLQQCTDAVVQHVDAAFARIWVLADGERTLELRASSGMYTHLDGPHSRVPLGALKIGLIGEEQKPHLSNDVQSDPRVGDHAWAKREGLVAFAGYPLLVEGRLVGVVALFARRPLGPRTFRELEVIATQLAVAIDRSASDVSLRRSELRYQLATRATRDAVWDWNLITNSLVWNEGVHALFGATEADVAPGITYWQEAIHPEDRERVLNGIHDVIDSGAVVWQDEYRFRRADGTYALVLDRGYVARDAERKAVQMVGAMQDITERKRREEDLANALRVNEMFVGILGHDLRNPLGAILAGAELLGQQLSDERQLRTLRRMGSAGERMTDMIEQLLDLTRARLAGGLGFLRSRKRLDVGNLVHRTVEELRVSNPDRDVRVETTGDCSASGDADRLLQLFSNLIANALLHGTPGTPLSVAVEGTVREVVVRVSNRGVVPADVLPTIFDPFKGRERTSAKSHGLGLGLFISQQIASAHGGSVTVESSQDHGTVFTVTVLKASIRSKPARTVGHAKTVLIVDDDENIRGSLRDAFEDEGYETLTASNGEEALELLEQREPRPDVVILDLVMPVMDGRRVYQAMQANAGLAKIPVIVSTSDPARAPAGAVILAKPLKLDPLLDAVANLWQDTIK